MRLVCYPTSGESPKIVAAPVERTWMEQSINRFAYRCLPINIANSQGWLILNSLPFISTWSGEPGVDAVSVQPCGADGPLLARSHFGSGVLTFNVNALFRTEPGYDLMVTGPLNQPKDAIQPLTGVVETDWAPFTFTMNWKFTRKFKPISFERDEPFCMIFPLKRGLAEEIEPEIRSMETDGRILENYRAYAESRGEFNKGLRVPGSDAQIQGWQRDYFRGGMLSEKAPRDHRTRIKLKDFKPIL
jgi:hypothetical protein